MLEMNVLSQLHEESDDLRMDEAAWQEWPSADGSRQWAPGATPEPLLQWGPATAPGGRPSQCRSQKGDEALLVSLAPGAARPYSSHRRPWLQSEEGEEFDAWEDDWLRFSYLEEEQLHWVVQATEYPQSLKKHKMYLRTPRAREIALDGSFQMHWEDAVWSVGFYWTAFFHLWLSIVWRKN